MCASSLSFSPPTPHSPLRIATLFLRQVAPFAMLVEKAGGKTSDGVTGQSCLDIKIEAVDQVPCTLARM